MSGCRHDAKNTLVKNYLYLAEQNGAEVLPLTTVTRLSPRGEEHGGGWDVHVRFTKAKTGRASATRVLRAEQVVLAAGSLGTQRLLHRMRDEGHLPRLSPRLGELSRTNSESILGAIAPDTTVDFSQGVAITSSFHPDPRHPHRAGPLRQGQQHHGAAADGADRRRRSGAALAHLAAGDVAQRAQRRAAVRRQALVGADRHRAGDAEPRQLDHHLHQAGPRHAAPLPDLEAGPRRAEPDLDPGRQQGGAADGQGDRRHRRRLDRRALQHADDRALPRRLRDRRLAPRPA